MSLPKRVQAELEAAEALQAQMDQQALANAPQAIGISQVPPPVPNEPPSANPPPPPAPVPPPPPKEDFEHKYKVLQGMYAADVKNLSKQLSELTSQFQSFRETKAPAPEPVKATVDPKDVEAFGADLIEMVQRYAERQAAEVERRLTALEATVHGVAAQSAQTQEQTFYATLNRIVPDWRDINVDPRWLAWLGQRDPVYGAPRQAALDQAFSRLDAEHVASVFNAFVASLPAAPAPASLEDQVAPSSVSSTPPAAPAARPVITQKSITDFYNDVSRGRYVGRESEQARLEAEINAALAEGRVR